MAFELFHSNSINSEDPWQSVVCLKLLLVHVRDLEVVASIVLEDLIHHQHVREPDSVDLLGRILFILLLH